MKPKTTAELAEIITSARSGLRIHGGGTRQELGNPVAADDTVLTGGITGIKLYEPGALTLSAGAGTPLSEIEAALDEHGQELAFEPMDHRGLLASAGEPSIGGVVACNASGPRRIQAGACRDSVIGITFVDGTGKVVRNGGRVMKNVTGYDLVKLLAGSYGTLGILTEVTFKLLPRAEARAVVLIEGLTDEQAMAAMSRAVTSPFGVTGAAHTPRGIDGDPVTMIRIEGFAGSVRYRSERLARQLSDLGTAEIETDPARTAAGWRWVRDAESFHGKPGDVWRVSVRPGDGARVARSARIGFSEDIGVLYDWCGGLVWLLVPEQSDVRNCLGEVSGHATIVRGGVETRNALGAFHPEPAPLARIAGALRRKFDPRQILNPGLMGAQPDLP